MGELVKIVNPSEFIKNVYSMLSEPTANFMGFVFYADDDTKTKVSVFAYTLQNPLLPDGSLDEKIADKVEQSVTRLVNIVSSEETITGVTCLIVNEDLPVTYQLAHVVVDVAVYAGLEVKALIASDMNVWADLILQRAGAYDPEVITAYELNKLL